MNEVEARSWIAARNDVSRETVHLLDRFIRLLIDEADCQNLISPHDREVIWGRHVADSIQLVDLAQKGDWIDLGTGAGFPGIVVGIVRPHENIVLVEERAKRASFLTSIVKTLELRRVSVVQASVEKLPAGRYANISARAFAPLQRLFENAVHLSDENTRWLLPKGRSAANELEAARQAWQGSFELKPSITDPDSAIIIASGVSKRTGI